MSYRSRYSGRSYRSTYQLDMTPPGGHLAGAGSLSGAGAMGGLPMPYTPPDYNITAYTPGQQLDAKTEEEKRLLKVASVDFEVRENARNHHTDKYDITEETDDLGAPQTAQLVVRRGDPFDVTITFDRPYDADVDDIKLVFTAGPKPRPGCGTLVEMLLSDDDKPRQWGAKQVGRDGNSLRVRVLVPPKCIVAKWEFKFDSVLKKDKKTTVFRYTHAHNFYVIFNPWCTDDQVYMDDPASREEYVLNDRGLVYRGTTKQISAKPWNFGQFEDFMLDCVMHLLDKTELNYRMRGNPVTIVRKISAIANSSDDQGILMGNWSGNYAGGTSPLAWVGSVRILQEYWKTLQPVQFGQCWVFSGVVTTLCRTLGIPTRSVTNFASAHDTDASVTIDAYYDADGRPLKDMNRDSVWNFHVWNDTWMARPDLPAGFGGWQAIDATPQETSDGMYCSGPASLEAIKSGLINLPYDSIFIFSEVNADRIMWVATPNGGWRPIKKRHMIGKHMSSKGVTDDRLDVTNCYKYPEGSQQEKTAVWRAMKEGHSEHGYVYSTDISDIEFQLNQKESTLFGEPFEVAVDVKNVADQDRTVRLSLTTTIMYYTGVMVSEVKKESFKVSCPPKSTGKVSMKVSVDEYLDKVVDMCNILINCMAQVEETDQYFCESDDFRLLKPDLKIEVPAEVTQGQTYSAQISFTNPLPRALTKCEFTVEGPMMQKPIVIKNATVGPHAEVKVTTELTARRVGSREIMASFESKELSDVSGSAKLNVVAKTDNP